MKRFLQKLPSLNLLRALNFEKYTRTGLIGGGIALLLVSNLLIAQLPFRLDFSQGQAYTLSSSTKKLAQTLKKPVVISLYISSDLPAGLQPLRREVKDLLDEYDRASGNISVREYNPKSDAEAKKRAQEASLPEIPFQQQGQNKFEIAAAFFGLVVEYDGKKETIPQLTDVESLEYNITSRIYKLTRGNLPKVAIVGQEAGFLPQSDPIANLKEVLRNQFDIQSVSLPTPSPAEGQTVSEAETKPFALDSSHDAALVFVNPSDNYDTDVAKSIKSYLDTGGKAIVFMNGIGIEDNLQTASSSAAMLDMLSGYGIGIEKNVILSAAAEIINVGGQQGMTLLLPYPLWPRTNQFDPKSSYFSGMNYLAFPWTSSLKLAQNKQVSALIMTTNQSWQQQGTLILEPQQITEPSPDELRQFVIGAEAKTGKDGRLFVIPSARFAVDRYAPGRAGNVSLVLNVLNDYASQGALSGIRQRTVAFYPLPDLPQNLQNIFQYSNILILPGLFALYGAARLYRRSKKNKQLT
jgi:ABC-type uncharacterized transport system involved in gliding motility auxiliary subunit